MKEQEPSVGDQPQDLLPEAFNLAETGWQSFSEYLLDVSGLVPRPAVPPLRGRPIRYRSTSYLRGWHANAAEEHISNLLRREGKPSEVIEEYGREMRHYRETVRLIVSAWRHKGDL